MTDPTGPRLAIEPEGIRGWLRGPVEAGGATVVPVDEADALLWAAPDDPDGLRRVLEDHGDHLRWVQLPWAGIEPYVDVLDRDRTWTCGKGVYAEPVAEMALALSLAGLRGLDRYARATTWREHGTIGTNLHRARLVVLGGGGITRSFLRMVAPFECRTTVVRRRPDGPPPAPGVDVIGDDGLHDAVVDADLVVLALALTPATTGIVDAALLERMGPRCHLVNVARGGHVVTDDLVAALRDGTIAGAGLDVTDPEPLPDGHPLWTLPNCTITPHVGNTPEMAVPLLSARITENVRRWAAGEPLVGLVDVDLGY
ncbi:D-isomer specific 2-hydroxyacid dehydrogenase family protein [Dermatobacter hominis]|uniref:D-isomer specific 2-hydroxyacid dehydrogenase family protein n=1 Tax=Dermatobacter hominis TaxID=2884263 RepID=UPI001D0F7608|nr:D-isomer specific 2-hydroxyacid dehydrogenase family protein [Dermatobacter hominis]UDY34622.1 D-isomer specific 2-hydroxyacid dehydrogenase family protein [Dermatobacter hominis]